MKFSAAFILSTATLASARFIPVRRADFTLQNGQDALAAQAKFAGLTSDSPCEIGETACISDQFAECVNNKFVLTACTSGLVCRPLPLVNSAGTSNTCTTDADFQARVAATGATTAAPSAASTPVPVAGNNAGKGDAAGNNGNSTTPASGNNDSNPDTSLTLDPAVIATGFANDGQDKPTAGQVPSLTSTNNFINFCKNKGLPLTNGQQVKSGSCNPAPMGIIAAQTNMPSCKFVFPINGAEVEPNQSFTVKLAQKNLETGFFTNANNNYFSAPQQIDSNTKNIQGHQHITIEKITSFDQTEPTDPTRFAFFKGLNDKAEGGILSAEVTQGLDEGFYRMQTITSAANHQPVLVAVAQRGGVEDVVYFTVKKGANPNASFGKLVSAGAAGNSTAAAGQN